MSPSSRESNLAQYREGLLQLNTQFFQILSERRTLCMKIQELKETSGRFAHYDPERERDLFKQLEEDLKVLTIKELLSFSLIMEDQAQAMAPGAYPTWSQGIHLSESSSRELFTMINPLLLKATRPELFSRLQLTSEFSFLKEF